MYTSRGETCRTEIYPEDGYVIKRFVPRKPKFGRDIDPLRGSLYLGYYRELVCLKRLKGHKHFPQIIDHNEKDLWIKMTYVGENYEKIVINDPEIYTEQINTIVDTLTSKKIKLAYEWKPRDGKEGYCLSMMMFRNHILSIIDFERAWPVGCDRGAEFSELFIDSFRLHNDEELRSTLVKTISSLYEKK